MDLITLENEFPVFNPHLRTLLPYKKIITRDKNRDKRNALKELAYVYFMSDYASPIWNLDEDRREKELLRMCELDEDWKPDELILEAVEHYKKLQKTPTISALEEMRESMHSTARVIRMIRQTLNELLDTAPEDEDSADLGASVKLLKDINSLANEFPKLVESLEKVELKVKREVEEKTGRGKKPVGEFELRSSVS